MVANGRLLIIGILRTNTQVSWWLAILKSKLAKGMSFHAYHPFRYGARNPPLSGDDAPTEDQEQYKEPQCLDSAALHASVPLPDYANAAPDQDHGAIDPSLLTQIATPEHQRLQLLAPSHDA
jgi:hypothetical protein